MSSAELVDPPAGGRVFERTIRPGIADAGGDGRVRLDAVARWLQDIAYLDLLDAGFDQRGVWIVRRARLRIEAWPRFAEELELRTFCSGIGRFSAERTTTIRGGSAAVESVALWAWLDESGRPRRFPERFVEIYAESAAGRGAPVRLRHPDPPPAAAGASFAFRATDIDVAGHVNNSHYWAPLEEELAEGDPGPLQAEIEYRDAGGRGEHSVIRDGDRRWIAASDGRVLASILLAQRD
ncbi:MAG TPA: acyl-ACP thioesterase domain-containing protein [Solirubrobacterales bacterium]|nr:acyl-ACP thioesterase domain-containing protein [Solirubrobacterales bacterium]